MNSSRDKFRLPKRYEDKGDSVWTEYHQIASEYNPINLGQGFPDFPPLEYVTDALAEVALDDDKSVHQYTRGFGHPRLVTAISKPYSPLVLKQIDPYKEILTTLGAYNAIYITIMALIDIGDEVIIMEPFFECYEHNVRSAGGVPRFIPLKLVLHFNSTGISSTDVEKPNPDNTASSADCTFDPVELESLFNARTKAIIINTPHNPLGKVFTYEELNFIAELCEKWNVLAVSDEVYEWLVYDSNTHIRIASISGMWDRTITICSAGKMFGVTGWKLGWAYGPADLISNMQKVHHNCVRAGNTILQEAAAICIEKELACLDQNQSLLNSMTNEFEKKRDFMAELLKEIGMKPILPQGGYFMVADWSPLEGEIDLSSENDVFKDYRFTKWMAKTLGVLGIPPTAFYVEQDKHLGEYFVRFCFVKKNDTLERAAELLKSWRARK